MAEPIVATVTTLQSKTGSGADSYSNISGAILTGFVADQEYLVFVWASVMGSNTGNVYGWRLALNGTAVSHTEHLMDPIASSGWEGRFWPLLFTPTDADDELTLQFKTVTTTRTVNADQITMVAIPTSELESESDYWLVDDDTDDSLTTSTVDGATKTFTPANGDVWAIFSLAEILVQATPSPQIFTELVTPAGTPRHRIQPQAVNDVLQLANLAVFTGAGSEITVTERSATDTGANHTRRHSRLVGLRLSAFPAHAAAYTTGTINVSLDTAFATEVQTTSLVLSEPKTVLVIGSVRWTRNSVLHPGEARVQVNDTDLISTQTSDQYRYCADHNAASPVWMQGGVVELGAATHDIDMDGSAVASSPPVVVSHSHRVLIAIAFHDVGTITEETLTLQEQLTKTILKEIDETVTLDEPPQEKALALIAVVSEVRAITARGNNHRIFVSEDNGRTWDLLYFLVSEKGKITSRLLGISGTVFYAGDLVFPAAGWYQQAGVSRINIGGDPVWFTTWTSEQINAVPNISFTPWRIMDFTDAGGGHLIAVGERMLPDSVQQLAGGSQLLHSNDNGATWQEPTGVPGAGGRALAVLAVGSNILVGGTTSTTISRSTDGGHTFSEILLLEGDPGPRSFISVITSLGAGIVLAGGRGGDQPRLWRSTDNGNSGSWTDVTSGIVGLENADSIDAIVNVGGGVVAICISGEPSNGHRYFRVSRDNGLTFGDVGTYNPSPVGLVTGTANFPGGRTGVLAEDGSVIFGITRGSISAVVELWRGVISADDVHWVKSAEYFHTQFSGSFMDVALVRLSNPSPIEPPEVPELINCPDFFDEYKFRFDITSPQQGREWLEREIFYPMGVYPVILSDGRISLRRFRKRV